jgi:hypothetical protein
MKKGIILVTVISSIVWFAHKVGAATEVGGVIDTDTTWTVAGSPYIVVENVIVNGTFNPTLTIEPGVTIKFNQYRCLFIGNNSDPSKSGRIVADGSLATITFTSNQTTHTPGYWDRIYFSRYSDDTSLLKHVIIEYGGSSWNGNICCYTHHL